LLIKAVTAFLLLILVLLLPSSQAQAAGIGVVPSKLELEASPLGSATTSINVLNSSSKKALYQVYIEGDCESWLGITPTEFILEPQGSQEIMITLSPPLTASGEHDVSVCIVALTPVSELNVGCGVKIPTHIKITAPPPLAAVGIDVSTPPLLGIGGGTVIGIVTGILLWRKRRSHVA